MLPADAALGWGVDRSRRLVRTLTGTPSNGAVIYSGEGWGAAGSSAKPPVEPSTKSLPVMAAPPAPPPGDASGVDPGVGTTEGPPVGPSTPPAVDVTTPTGSSREVEEETVAQLTQAVSRRAFPTIGPVAADPTSMPQCRHRAPLLS